MFDNAPIVQLKREVKEKVENFDTVDKPKIDNRLEEAKSVFCVKLCATMWPSKESIVTFRKVQEGRI